MVAGNLNIDEGCRRLVPADIWYRFKTYFPDAPEFTGLAEVCHECYVRALSDISADSIRYAKLVHSE